MSILIKGMGMPESCEDCSAQIIDPTGGASGCAVNHSIILRKRGERRPAECPLVEVPKHGRLIDGEEVLRAMNTWPKYGYDERCRLVPWNENLVPYVMFEDMVRAVVGMPTIIEQDLIRCKDCKWFGEIGCAIGVVDDTDKPTENDYCSFAERRTDG